MSSTDVDDLLGPVKPPKQKRKKRKSVSDLLGSTYKPLKPPKSPHPDGIFALKEKKGKNLGKTCLGCNRKLDKPEGRGRPPLLCGRDECFRTYRNAYRLDYDRARA